GAGATAACGGPMTASILPDAYQAVRDGADRELFGREDFFPELATFLKDEFHVNPFAAAAPPKEAYPPLPLLLSLVDTALDRKQPLGLKYGLRELRKVRQAVEYVVFALLDHRLRQIPAGHNYYRKALELVRERTGEDPAVITLNYDILVDNAMLGRNEERAITAIPDYGVELAYSRAIQPEKRGTLLKIHGSLNWFYCPACNRLSLGISRSLASTYKVTYELFSAGHDLNKWYTCHGMPCAQCGEVAGQDSQAFVEPLLITPTHLKDYRNPHISRLWYLAEKTLREAERVVFVGYSLPEDDLEVAYLLKRALTSKKPEQITVVEYDPKEKRSLAQHDVGRRYRSLLGVQEVGWRTDGFQGWIDNPRL
ncbi:MAG TPA: hypothetical protein VN914_01365, partial [Polyangia bacterium]|nr:hypothetical protein [Polyangia bacterium]